MLSNFVDVDRPSFSFWFVHLLVLGGSGCGYSQINYAKRLIFTNFRSVDFIFLLLFSQIVYFIIFVIVILDLLYLPNLRIYRWGLSICLVVVIHLELIIIRHWFEITRNDLGGQNLYVQLLIDVGKFYALW